MLWNLRWPLFGFLGIGLLLNAATPYVCVAALPEWWKELVQNAGVSPCRFGGVFLAIEFVGVGLWTFFAFLRHGTDSERMRVAIAASIVVVYVSLVGTAAWLGFAPKDQEVALNPLTQAVITSFTATVGVVIAFYFGSTAYVDAQRERRGAEQGSSQGASSSEQPGASETTAPPREGAEPRPEAPGAQEGVQRPWWRRWFGG